MQVLFLQGHSTCFGRQAPIIRSITKLARRPLVQVLLLQVGHHITILGTSFAEIKTAHCCIKLVFILLIGYNVDSRADDNKVQILVVYIRGSHCVYRPGYDVQNGGVLDLYSKGKWLSSRPRRPYTLQGPHCLLFNAQRCLFRQG